jgi:CRP-like cAMP-binding protein
LFELVTCQSYEKNTVVYKEGELSMQEMYVILEGEVGLVKQTKYVNADEMPLNLTSRERWTEYGIIKHILGAG